MSWACDPGLDNHSSSFSRELQSVQVVGILLKEWPKPFPRKLDTDTEKNKVFFANRQRETEMSKNERQKKKREMTSSSLCQTLTLRFL